MNKDNAFSLVRKIAKLSAIFLSIACGSTSTSAQDNLIGRATVIDGDTIEIHSTRIRLHGIDAPEAGQTCMQNDQTYRCGQKSALALDNLISNNIVNCNQKDVDRYGRIVAECFSESVNLNVAMVQSGWALAYRQYSSAYVDFERAAQDRRAGMWVGEFQAPWDFRKGPSAEEIQQSNGCLIKGNINAQGRKIYHMPGTSTYGRTQINEKKGERWFCNEEQAISAGWLPVRR